jgi:ribose-phosphate pyrophosphokinase
MEIARHLRQAPGEVKLGKFANGETRVQLLENVRGSDVFLMQTAAEPINDNLVELFIMIDAARRASAGKINVVCPNYFYARQDRKTASREPITSKLMADFIADAGTTRFITVDLHSDQEQGFFNIPVDNLPTAQLFMERAKALIDGSPVVVALDAGSAKKSTNIAYNLGTGLAIINKTRLVHNEARALHLLGESVKGKTCLIFDDMLDTGGSLCAGADLLRTHGASQIIAFITHGIFSGDALEKIEKSRVDRVIVTDSMPLRVQSKKIEVMSIAKYLAQAILHVHNDTSVSVLFGPKAARLCLRR